MNTTIGEEAAQMVREYKEVYTYFKADPQFKDKARSLALHDLILGKWKFEIALKELTAWIEEQERSEQLAGKEASA